MLCAKYSYKDDIAVKKQEAFEDGQQQKAIEAARNLYSNGVSVEIISNSLGMSKEQVQEIIQQEPVYK